VTKFFRAAPLTPGAFITTLVFIAALGYFAVKSALALANGNDPEAFDLFAGLGLALIIAYAWLRSVKGYALVGREVVINRAGPGKIHIPLDGITSMEVQPDLGSFIKPGMFSIQGLFGWAGTAKVRKPTDVISLHAQVYGTNPANMVVLRLNNGRVIILTPSDTTGFAESLRVAGVGSPPRVAAGHYKTTFQAKKKRN
jgi:hypothetical protein